MVNSKSKNLESLAAMGLKVPAFFVITPQMAEDKLFDKFGKDAHQKIRANKYAVRSNSVKEDCSESSNAGQFLTKLDVQEDELAEAVEAVCKNAGSAIVQEFVEPDYSGVFFTRNPNGDRSWVLEYHAGRGDALVGGEIKPKQVRGYWGQKSKLPVNGLDLRIFKKIEDHFGFPQDVEWCIKNGQFYVLQTRNITSFGKDKFEQMKFLDKVLPKEPFLYEKTEISEIAPRPDAETLDILRKIYSSGGPVEKTYQKYGISYDALDFLILVQGELYVDRIKELLTLFPSYGYSQRGKQQIMRLKGLLTSLKNAVKLRKLPLQNHADYFELLEKRFKKPSESFFEDYAMIFEINLLSSVALENLKIALKQVDNKQSASKLLCSNLFPAPILNFNHKGLVGNSLNLSDRTDFLPKIQTKVDKDVQAWFKQLSHVKQRILEKPLKLALIYVRLREYARWLLVLHANKIRPAAKRNPVENCAIELPNRLTNLIFHEETCLQGLSAGIAEGKLLNLQQIKSGQKGVLYTSSLTPDLVQYFKQTSAIVAEHGGLLSHLAIMAREHGIPVVSGATNLQLGDYVKVYGDNGVIEVI